MSLADLRIVLIQTSHPGNIGAAARAMKNMGLGDLYLVRPKQFPSAEASARASGATDVLAGARVCAGLHEAIADCSLVLGASARLRSIPWPRVDAREGARRALAHSAQGPVAVVFGNEQWGLSNEEMDVCHFLLHIPSNPDYSSLNLAQSVQVVAYELRMAALESAGEEGAAWPGDSPPATAAEMDALYTHMEQALKDIGFLDPAAPRQLMRRIRRLFNRLRLEHMEVSILRGILAAAQRQRGGGEGRH
jgi:tRNA (cytidine32/uridine32-2'-O)-methyltransferase